MVSKILYLAIIFLFFSPALSAAQNNEYKITYIINIKEDGTAAWNVEYRTILTSKEDFDSFENYTQQLQSVYLKEFIELMQNSANRAAAATAREMTAKDFTGSAAVQSTPTGAYGVVHYSFTWTNFAKVGPNINVGDVFVSGLYLSKDNVLIIRYPSDYKVEQVTPLPDLNREGMIWYGPRSFGGGEPRIILTKTSFPWKLFIIVVFIIAAGASFIYLRKTREKNTANIMEADTMDLENRILMLLKESGGSLYQSEIGKRLGLPKSTVSSALNELSNKNIINKIKKGRENLIRLT